MKESDEDTSGIRVGYQHHSTRNRVVAHFLLFTLHIFPAVDHLPTPRYSTNLTSLHRFTPTIAIRSNNRLTSTMLSSTATTASSSKASTGGTTPSKVSIDAYSIPCRTCHNDSPSSPWNVEAFKWEKGLVDTRIKKIRPLIPPVCLLEELPTSAETQQHIIASRITASRIINGFDDRIMVVIGPCSIHDPKAAIEYAQKLKPLADKYGDDLFIVMRAYLEKPRTTVGWKGLINDPQLDGSFNINTGLRVSRKLLQDLNGIGLPLAMEMLDTYDYKNNRSNCLRFF